MTSQLPGDSVRPEYDESIQQNVVSRIAGYAGQKRKDVTNPNLTAREAVALADYYEALRLRLEAAERDAARLEFLIKARCVVDNDGNGRHWVYFPFINAPRVEVCSSARKAIDAIMAIDKAIAAEGAGGEL